MAERMRVIDNGAELSAISGPMFCGKSSLLLETVARFQIMEYRTCVFKPSLDNRYDAVKVSTHSGRTADCILVDHRQPFQIVESIIKQEEDGVPVEVVAVDEAQFFDPILLDVVSEILSCRKKVIVAGLPTDFRDMPFGVMPDLIVKADLVYPQVARCMNRSHMHSRPCGDPATKTQRLVNGDPANWYDPVIMVGAKEAYEARCRDHHLVSIDTPNGKLVVNPGNVHQTETGVIVYDSGKQIEVPREW